MLPQPQPPLRKNLRSVGGHVRGGRVVGAAYTATHTSSLQFSSGKGVGLVELRLGSRQRHGRRPPIPQIHLQKEEEILVGGAFP